MTDPAVGASVWASGSHVCSGNSGTFTAKAMAKARNSQRAADQSNGLALVESSTTVRDSAISTRSKSSGTSSCRRSISACCASVAPLGLALDSAMSSWASAAVVVWTASRWRNARVTMPTSISAEPNIVNRKNLSAA